MIDAVHLPRRVPAAPGAGRDRASRDLAVVVAHGFTGSWRQPRVAPTPMLVVHGDRDAYFPLEHAYALAEAAGPTATLWVERGFGHAEGACAPALAGRILGWVVEGTREAG